MSLNRVDKDPVRFPKAALVCRESCDIRKRLNIFFFEKQAGVRELFGSGAGREERVKSVRVEARSRQVEYKNDAP